jgi:hypothetical protein
VLLTHARNDCYPTSHREQAAAATMFLPPRRRDDVFAAPTPEGVLCRLAAARLRQFPTTLGARLAAAVTQNGE